MKKILRDVLLLDKEIQTVGTINTRENTFMAYRNSATALLPQSNESSFALEQEKILLIQKKFEGNFGTLKSYFVFHEKVNLLFFRNEEITFFIICGKKYQKNELLELIKRIEKILLSTEPKEDASTKFKKTCQNCLYMKCLKGCRCSCHDRVVQKIIWDMDYL